MLAGDLDHLLEKRQLDTLGGRVARKIQHQHFRPRPGVQDGAFQLLEKIHIGRHTHVAYIGTGDDKSVGMDRVSRVRHQHGIAGTHGRQCQMRQPLFGADGNNRLAIGIELYIIAIAIPARNRPAQPRDAP